MKKYCKLLFVGIASMVSIAMSAQSHLQFKGIEINGSIQSVMSQLEQQGFQSISAENLTGSMVGNFTGRTVTLLLSATPVSKNVYTIIVVYDDPSDESLLFTVNDMLKTRLTKKYGEPLNAEEQFQSPYSRTESPRQAFMSQQAVCRTVWKLDQGAIAVSIQNLMGQVVTTLVYADQVNTALNESEMDNDL